MVPDRSPCALSVENRGDETVVRFAGDSVELDDQTASGIQKELFSLADQHGGRDLVMDFQQHRPGTAAYSPRAGGSGFATSALSPTFSVFRQSEGGPTGTRIRKGRRPGLLFE